MAVHFARTLAPAAALLALLASPLAAQTAGASSAVPTFSRDVAPILHKHCVTCHRPGEMAPMSLLTFQEARPWVRSIRTRIEAGTMPPWHAEAPFGTFSNDRRLTAAEKETIVRWAAGGAPEGDPNDLPTPPVFPKDWRIGTPDLVVSMPKPFEVPASGTIDYQNFDVPTNLTEDKWVQALELRATAPAVVHHILVFGREPGGVAPQAYTQRALPNGGNHGVVPPRPTAESGTPGQRDGSQPPRRLLATLAPGTSTFVFPEGAAMKIQAGTTFVFQVHYTANGTPATDQSSIGLVFAKEPPRQEMRVSHFMNTQLFLPAGSANQRVDAAIEFTADSHIVALFPHTHPRGKSWEYRMVYPDGRSEVVLSVPKYDFNWQTYYQYARPIPAPKGSRLEAIAHYDNSTANKANPDPTADVRWGEQTWEEMQYTGITYTVDAPRGPTAQGQQP
jgi:hypothetical protein